jgi:ATP-binding cassette, subfamily C (CFTR/MRP), member 1
LSVLSRLAHLGLTEDLQSTAATLAVVQLACLAVVAATWRTWGQYTVTAAVLTFIASVVIAFLVQLEHLKSVRPSFLISAYLFVSILLDVGRVRTAWLQGDSISRAAILIVTIVIKLILLGLETVEKRQILYPSEKGLSQETTSGPFSRGFFTWLNGLLRSGFSSILTVEGLPSIYERLAANSVHARFDKAWRECGCRPKLR